MSNEDGFYKKKSTRTAAIEAAKRIKINAEMNALYEDVTIAQSDVETSDNKSRRNSDRKLKIEDHVFSSEELTRDSSKDNSEWSHFLKSDMRKKRQGCPTKKSSEKCASTRRKLTKNRDATCKEEENDVNLNLNLESYNEPKHPMPFSGSKQLVVGDGGISYRESVTNLTLGLGSTAKNVAHGMLQQTHQARHQLKPLIPSPDARRPHLFDLNSINNSAEKILTTQVNQSPISLGGSYANSIENRKGKGILADGGKSDRDKLSIADKPEILFGKQKGGVKIGTCSLDINDFGRKKAEYNQVGNQRTNKIGSFCWNASNRIPNASIFPLANMPLRSPGTNMSGSSLGYNNDVTSFSWVPQPTLHRPTPVQPSKNWCPPPYSTISKSPPIELPLTLSLDRNLKHQERPNAWSQNLRAPTQTHQFLQAHSHGPAQQKPPTPPSFWSEIPIPEARHELNLLPFSTQQDSGFSKGNRQQHKPPGF